MSCEHKQCKKYAQKVSAILTANPVLGRLGFSVEKLTAAFQQGQKAGTEAEEAPVLQQIEARILADRCSRTASLPASLFSETAILDKGTGFRRGYSVGLQAFLSAHNVDMKLIMNPHATPEGLMSDSVLVGYLRGLRRQSPDRGRKIFQRTATEKPFSKFPAYEPAPEWLSLLRFRSAQQQGGYKLGFLVGVARDFTITLSELEVPVDNPSYEAYMQGSRGETRPMPIDLTSKTNRDKIKDSGLELENIWVYGALDNNTYTAGQRVWLASKGVDVSYTRFIRHPEAFRAFKAALEGQEYTSPPRILGNLTAIKIVPQKINFLEKIYPKDTFYELQRPDPLAEARAAGQIGYEMGQLARQKKLSQSK